MKWWKVLLTWPYLLKIYTKAGSMTKKVLKEPNVVPESKRYQWLQKKVRYINWLYNVKIITHNQENWPKHKGCVLIANHQSNFDALAIIAKNDYKLYAPVGFIAKEELKKSRIARRFVFLIDVLFINRKDPRTALEVLQEAKVLIRVPRTMVIFPEGTRSHSSNMNEFKPGALKLAYQAYVPILPVSIIDTHKITDKKNHHKKVVHIIFHKPIEPQSFINIPSQALSNKLFNIIKKGIEEYS